MPHVLDAAVIRKKLSDYLTGDTSLDSFHAWLIPATWDFGETASKATRELVYEIKLSLAEYTSGHLTENDLRANLRRVATSFPDVSFVSGVRWDYFITVLPPAPSNRR